MSDVKTAHVGNDQKTYQQAPLDTFACPNPACPDHGKLGRKNIDVYARYGMKQVRLLICRSCVRTFSELYGTPLHDSRLDYGTIGQIFIRLTAGEAIRRVAMDVKKPDGSTLSKNTPKRYIRVALKDPDTLWKQIEAHVGRVKRADYDELLNRMAKSIVIAKEHAVPPRKASIEAAASYLRRKPHAART